MTPFQKAEASDCKATVRRIVQGGGAALVLWTGGSFVDNSDPKATGYDYTRIEAIRAKHAAEKKEKAKQENSDSLTENTPSK